MFDAGTIELTAESVRQFERDTDIYYKALSNSSTEFDVRKAHDDAFTNIMLSTIPKLVKDSIRASPLMDAHTKLSYDNCARTKSYLNILSHQYSKGNSTTTVAEISKFFSLTQTTEVSAVFLANVSDQLSRVRPLIESTEYPGHVKIDKLLSLVIIKGLDKKQLPNLRALEIHVQTHTEDVLDVPTALMNSIIAIQTSDLATLSDNDPEVSAFLAASTKPAAKAKPTAPRSNLPTNTTREKGTKIASRDDHCTNCFNLIQKYFYHPLKECNRTAHPPARAFTATIDEASAREARISQSFATLRQEGYDFSPAEPSSSLEA
jgi:hypothetical protein